MGYRKIIAFGKNSYVASLPKDWVRKNELKKGDLLFVEEEGNKLVYSPSKEEEKVKEHVFSYNVDDLGIDEIKRLVLGAYISGYKKIILEGSTIVNKSTEIKKIINDLIAFEVEELNHKKIVAKDFLNIQSTSLMELIKKMDNTLRSMMEDLKKSIKNHKNINIRDEDVNRLSYLIFKVIKYYLRQPYMVREFSPADLTNLYELTDKLEKIADEVKRISRYLNQVNLDGEEKKNVIEIYGAIQEIYKGMMRAIDKKDIDLANKYSSKKRNILERIDDYHDKKYKIKALAYLLDRMKVMNSLVHNLARYVYEE